MLTVYSAHGSPGASTTAMYLAAQWASTGTEVLLIEADPGGGSLSHHLGIQFTPGSASFVASGLPMRSGNLIDHSQDVLFNNLHVMPATSSPTGAREIMRWWGDRASELRDVSEREMAVIIDGGRVTADSAAADLTAYAAGVVVVARGDSSPTSLEHIGGLLSVEACGESVERCVVTVGDSPMSVEEWREKCDVRFCGSVELSAEVKGDLTAFLNRNKRKSKKWRLSLEGIARELLPLAKPPAGGARPQRVDAVAEEPPEGERPTSAGASEAPSPAATPEEPPAEDRYGSEPAVYAEPAAYAEPAGAVPSAGVPEASIDQYYTPPAWVHGEMPPTADPYYAPQAGGYAAAPPPGYEQYPPEGQPVYYEPPPPPPEHAFFEAPLPVYQPPPGSHQGPPPAYGVPPESRPVHHEYAGAPPAPPGPPDEPPPAYPAGYRPPSPQAPVYPPQAPPQPAQHQPPEQAPAHRPPQEAAPTYQQDPAQQAYHRSAAGSAPGYQPPPGQPPPGQPPPEQPPPEQPPPQPAAYQPQVRHQPGHSPPAPAAGPGEPGTAPAPGGAGEAPPPEIVPSGSFRDWAARMYGLAPPGTSTSGHGGAS